MSDEDRDPFGLSIELARTAAAMSLEELGARVGKSSQTVRRYELGSQRPTFQTVCRMSEIFGLPLDYFAGRSKPKGGKATAATKQLPPGDMTPPDPAVSELRAMARALNGRMISLEKTITRQGHQTRVMMGDLRDVADWVADRRTAEAMDRQLSQRKSRSARGAGNTLETSRAARSGSSVVEPPE